MPTAHHQREQRGMIIWVVGCVPLEGILWGGRQCSDALGGNGPRRRPHLRFDRRLEEVAKAVGGGYCRLQMPLSLALAIREP